MLRKKILAIVSLILLFTLNTAAQDILTGVKLMRNEKFTEAKTYFNSLLTTKAKAEACFYLGEIYFLQEKVDSAKIFYTKGIEANNDFPLNYAGMVRVTVLDGNESEISRYANQAVDLGDENAKVYCVLADAYAHIKSYDKAKQWLDDAIKKKLSSAELYIMMGKVFLGQINGIEAIKSFEQALKIEPGNPEALTLKAGVYSLINNFDAAVSLLNEAISDDSTYSPAYHSLAEVYANMKDYAKASEYYSKYIAKSEATPDKLKRYAAILYLNKDYSQVIDIMKSLVAGEPDNSSSLRILAYSYLRLGDIENSKNFFEKLFALSGVNYLPTDYENYADLLSKTGNDSLALEYLIKVPQLDSTRKDIYGKISVLYFKNKNWNGVIDALTKKGDLTAQENFDLGKAYYFTQKYIEADSTFTLLTSKVPDLAISYFWLARVKTNFDPESDSGLAKPFYEKFLQLSNEDTVKYKKELIEAYSYLGYYYYLKTDNASSKLYWQKVYALDPTNSQAIEALKGL